MYSILAPLFVALIFGLPLVAAGEACRLVPFFPAGLLLATPVYVVVYVLVAGLLARPFVSSIVPGRFPRNLADPKYRRRRLYGLCWTAVYYMKPLYWMCLSVPPLKRLLFRLFGYRGSMDFTVYPDSWIRDLPLLDFGPGAYIANRATLGTNLALRNGTLIVDRITIGPGAMVGHMAMLATGVVLEEGAEVGVGCTVGCKVVFRKGADASPDCTIGHLAEIGVGAHLGFRSSVGMAARIGDGVRLPPHTLVPNRAQIDDAQAAATYLSAVLGRLPELTARLSELERDSAAATPPDRISHPMPLAPSTNGAARQNGAHSARLNGASRAPQSDLAAAATLAAPPAPTAPPSAERKSLGDSGILKLAWNRFE